MELAAIACRILEKEAGRDSGQDAGKGGAVS